MFQNHRILRCSYAKLHCLFPRQERRLNLQIQFPIQTATTSTFQKNVFWLNKPAPAQVAWYRWLIHPLWCHSLCWSHWNQVPLQWVAATHIGNLDLSLAQPRQLQVVLRVNQQMEGFSLELSLSEWAHTPVSAHFCVALASKQNCKNGSRHLRF